MEELANKKLEVKQWFNEYSFCRQINKQPSFNKPELLSETGS